MRGDALAVVEDFNDRARGSHLHALMDTRVVHAVVTLLEFDVVVDVHADIVEAVPPCQRDVRQLPLEI